MSFHSCVENDIEVTLSSLRLLYVCAHVASTSVVGSSS